MLKRILVTGAAGFIASHLCDDLIARGYEVVGLDNLDPQVHGPDADPPAYLNPAIEFREGSVCSSSILRRCLKGVDAVVHLAAKVGVGQSAYDGADYVFNNSYGTAVLCQELQKQSIKKLVVASSMSVYGEGQTISRVVVTKDAGRDSVFGEEVDAIATNEDKPPDLQSIYALTKYDQERLCLLFGRAYNVPTIALRFFNVYGTRQSLSNPYTGIMAIFASRLLNNQPPIIFEDGQQRRDFVHVSDICTGIRLALESEVSDGVINLGSGTSHTVLEIAEKLTTALGKDILPIITGEHRTGDIRHCFADISKAGRLLGYKPQVSLETGITELVEWLRTQRAADHLESHVNELREKGLLN